MPELTPKEVVARLDEHIIGQSEAKRAVAIALRNRWRWQRLSPDMRREVTPKNIIMIGPTGVGKTEITRRLAQLTGAPFVKVEATKYTEVGYYGRDVESIVRDLVEAAVQLEKSRKREELLPLAKQHVEERILDLLLPGERSRQSPGDGEAEERHRRTREKLRAMLAAGELEEREVEIRVERRQTAAPMLSNMGMDQMAPGFQDMFERLLPKHHHQRRQTVRQARETLLDQELDALLDRDSLHEEAIRLAEETGIIFIDEIDKIAGDSEGTRSIDVSRQGVQRDLLPIVEGTTVQTRYGNVETDHILFIAAGAFHRARPSDLMPELQGRFPIRVELHPLMRDDFLRILTEPSGSLTRQYAALLETEGVRVAFAPDGLSAIADIAWELNQSSQNIGARRLHTVLEKLLEEISFQGPELDGQAVTIDEEYVDAHLRSALKRDDSSQFIL